LQLSYVDEHFVDCINARFKQKAPAPAGAGRGKSRSIVVQSLRDLCTASPVVTEKETKSLAQRRKKIFCGWRRRSADFGRSGISLAMIRKGRFKRETILSMYLGRYAALVQQFPHPSLPRKRGRVREGARVSATASGDYARCRGRAWLCSVPSNQHSATPSRRARSRPTGNRDSRG
jgi:hypothetical protein